jgi:hypothetical protein
MWTGKCHLFDQVRGHSYASLITGSIKKGRPAVFLQLLDYVLLKFSQPLAQYLLAHNFNRSATSDLRFVE